MKIFCPKCRSSNTTEETFRMYKCNSCGFKFTTRSMSQRISFNDGYTYVEPNLLVEEEVSTIDVDDLSLDNAYSGGSSGGGGSSRSWDDESSNSYSDSGSDSGSSCD